MACTCPPPLFFCRQAQSDLSQYIAATVQKAALCYCKSAGSVLSAVLRVFIIIIQPSFILYFIYEKAPSQHTHTA